MKYLTYHIPRSRKHIEEPRQRTSTGDDDVEQPIAVDDDSF